MSSKAAVQSILCTCTVDVEMAMVWKFLATITNAKNIADEHAMAFTDNSSSVHYSATFQAI